MFKKIASNDKILENISTRMDTFASAIKNHHSFNEMIESQIAQLAAAVPPSDKRYDSRVAERFRNYKSCQYS
jgi:hypothetical protein